MSGPSDAEYRKGQFRLRHLLPWARAEVSKCRGATELNSLLSLAQAKYIVETNFDSLVIHPAPLGGWHADLILKHVPPGIPNMIGSPVAEPFATRPEAMEGAKRLLVCALQIAAEHALLSDGNPVFLLYGYGFKLKPEVYQAANKVMPGYRPYGSPEGAAERIEQVLQELCGDQEFDGEDFNSWDQERKLHLIAVLHGAALSGLYAYPQRRDASPSGHAAGQLSKAKH